MMTKNPAPIPIANSVSNMIDPPDGTPAPGHFVGLDLGDFVAPAGGPPFRLLEPYLRLTTLLVPGPWTRAFRRAQDAPLPSGTLFT